MTGEFNNINELGSNVENSTEELDAATFSQEDTPSRVMLESDDSTCDFTDREGQRAKTISKLQYDIEQLRSKWLGVEAEIKARREITDRLHSELAAQREQSARNEAALRESNELIRKLRSEIRDNDVHHEQLVADLRRQLDEARQRTIEISEPRMRKLRPQATGDIAAALAKSEDYADQLRRKLQDVAARHRDVEEEGNRLNASLARSENRILELERQLHASQDVRNELEAQLSSIQGAHEEEIRMLRFELGEAQETVAQTEDLNSQLTSDLFDTRGFQEELERMFYANDEQSRLRIEELEDGLALANRVIKELEAKLDNRSNAINVLLAELAHKTEQMESIEEIGNVVSEFEERISDEFNDTDETPAPTHRSTDRFTRVLLGKVGEKLLRFPLFKDRLTIGRTSDNDIKLNAPFISRRHAVVTTDGEKTRVIDWGSRNGVYVNSRRVTEHFLKNGDIVTIGSAHFRYEERPKRSG